MPLQGICLPTAATSYRQFAAFPGSRIPMLLLLLLLSPLTFAHTHAAPRRCSPQDNASARACFLSAAQQLRPGGCLIVELAHPGDLFDGTFIIGDGGRELWEVERKARPGVAAGEKLLVEWGHEFDTFDLASQVRPPLWTSRSPSLGAARLRGSS